MYSWSGRVLEARKVFDSLTKRDEVTYTSMIFGYGMKGEGETVLKLFEEMCKLDVSKKCQITLNFCIYYYFLYDIIFIIFS